MRLARRAAVLAVVACSAAGAAGAAAEDLSLGAAVGLVYSDDPAARRRGTARLREICAEAPAAAVAEVVSRAGGDPSAPQWRLATDALAAIGVEASIAAIECNRSRWGEWGLGGAAGADEDDATAPRLGDVLTAQLTDLRPAAAWTTSKLAPDTLADAFRVPPWAEHRIDGSLPPDLLWGDYPVRTAGDGIEVDTGRDGKFATKVTKPRIVAVKAGTRERRVLVYPRLGAWYACSPNVLRGGAAGRAVELLDADQDGEHDGARDLVRFGDGAFRRMRDGPLAFDGAKLFRFRIRRASGATVLETIDEPEPPELDGLRGEAMRALNRWRHMGGLVPQRFDVRRTAGCDLHCEYLRIHGFGAGLSPHDEDATKAGFTAAGAEAGGRSSLMAQVSAAELVNRIAPTILHRLTLLGPRHDGVGVASNGAAAAQWGGPPVADDRGLPLLYPAPGQTSVPWAVETERPLPDGDPAFYSARRGFPVFVTWRGLDGPMGRLRDCRIEMIEAGNGARMPGTQFDETKPYAQSFSSDGRAWFVPAMQLLPRTEYVIRVTGRAADAPVDISWRIRTE